MARTARKYTDSHIYHVMIRGINKQKIFYDEMDFRKFLKIIEKNRQKYGFCLLTYCLMSNHVHLLILDRDMMISQIMGGIEIAYALYFNKKYNRIGNLFQDRFNSKCVNDNNYFSRVVRYIHQNPEKAGICLTEEYKWSSYPKFLNHSKSIDYNTCFEKLGYNIENPKECLKKFIDFNTIKTYNYEEEVECEFENYYTDEVAKCIMEKILNDGGVYNLEFRDLKHRNQYIRAFKKMKYINNEQIAKIFNLKKKTISNIDSLV